LQTKGGKEWRAGDTSRLSTLLISILGFHPPHEVCGKSQPASICPCATYFSIDFFKAMIKIALIPFNFERYLKIY
jgi:hypothetical protein